jgi:hypothetical protein
MGKFAPNKEIAWLLFVYNKLNYQVIKYNKAFTLYANNKDQLPWIINNSAPGIPCLFITVMQLIFPVNLLVRKSHAGGKNQSNESPQQNIDAFHFERFTFKSQ